MDNVTSFQDFKIGQVVKYGDTYYVVDHVWHSDKFANRYALKLANRWQIWLHKTKQFFRA